MDNGYTIGAYLRISSEDEKLLECDSNSIVSQRERIREFISNNSELKDTFIKEYIDDGISGTNFERKAVATLIEDAKNGLINCVIVKDFSRFGRNYIETGTYIDKVFPFLGIRFISVNDNYDSNKLLNKAGSIDVAFKNMIHDFYSKDLSKKIISSKTTSAKQGKHMTAYAPYGFTKNKDKMLVPDIESADIVRRIYSMRLDGMGITDIAKVLNQEGVLSPLMLRRSRKDNFPCRTVEDKTYWKKSVIQSILKDRRYTGDAVYGKYKRLEIGSKKDIKVPESQWVIVENAHEAIVSKEDFEKVQRTFKTYNKKRQRHLELFTSKIRCAGCNHILVSKVYNNKSGKVVRYACNTKNNIEVENCVDSFIEEDIAKPILMVLKKYSQLVEEICQVNKQREKGIKDYEKEMKAHRNSLRMIQNMKLANYKDYKAESILLDVFMKKKSDYEDREASINNKVYALEEKIKVLKDNIDKSDDVVEDFNEILSFDTLTREMVEMFIDCIYINYEGRMTVNWRFGDLFEVYLHRIGRRN
ncbi:recombinase family protein [Clostridiaceae bacterium M8S5]|nr:recombinase family protein [Clostridiaceae bacterium M8S5]